MDLNISDNINNERNNDRGDDDDIHKKKRKITPSPPPPQDIQPQLQKEIINQGTKEWHDFRYHHICGSETSTLLGLSSYDKLIDLLAHKILNQSREITQVERELFKYGHDNEERIFKRYHEYLEKEKPIQNQDEEQTIRIEYSLPIQEDLKDPLFAASLDGMITLDKSSIVLEYKSKPGGRPYTKMDCFHYVQVQHCIKVMNSILVDKPIDKAHLVIWFEKDIHLKMGHSDKTNNEYIIVYEIEKDEQLWREFDKRLHPIKEIIKDIAPKGDNIKTLLQKIEEEEEQQEKEKTQENEDEYNVDASDDRKDIKLIVKKYLMDRIKETKDRTYLFHLIFKSIEKNSKLLCEKFEFF